MSADAASNWLYCFTLLAAAATPGPCTTTLIDHVLRYGYRGLVGRLLAMWLGELCWLTLAMSGAATLLQQQTFWRNGLPLLGALYLGLMAVHQWRRAAASVATSHPPSQIGPWVDGLLVTLSNPKIMLFYLALLPNLLPDTIQGGHQWLQMVLLTLPCLALVHLGWIALASGGLRLVGSTDVRLWISRGCALLQMGIALSLVIRHLEHNVAAFGSS